MPLLLSALTTDPGLPGAGDRAYPMTYEAAAAEWAAALDAYVAGMVPAVPPAIRQAAIASFEGTLGGVFGSPAPGVEVLDQALVTLAAALSAGMPPVATGIVPPGPPGIAQLLRAGGPVESRQAGVVRVANKIDAWMRTGLAAVPAAPGTWFPWS